MLVSVPLHLDTLPGKPKIADLIAVFKTHTRARSISVSRRAETLRASGRNRSTARTTSKYVYPNEARGQALLIAKFDNLGKGASGAAVQNLMLMLGR